MVFVALHAIPTFAVHVVMVVLNGAKKQVFHVDAMRHVAFVQHVQTGRYRTVRKFPGDPVSPAQPLVYFQTTVFVCPEAHSSPQVAPRCLVFAPLFCEALRKRTLQFHSITPRMVLG